jgi:transposase
VTTSESLPTDLAAAHAMILAERAARLEAEAVAASAKAEAANAKAAEALINYLKLEIEKLRRQIYGSRSERKARLLEQMELQLEELEATATEDELAAERAAAQTQTVRSFQRKRPSRKPFPDHLPRERVMVAAPENCPCCGSSKLSKLGEDITETLEVIPRQWKVIQTVREKFSCRDCETITQPPAPFHVTPRGFAGPNLLAMILFEKFGQHQPLNRQSERYAREGIDLSLSTLADQVGACAMALQPLYRLIERHVLTSERLHGDDTTVPILAKGQTVKGHIWTYVRDDRPFGGRAPPATLYYASRDRRQEHPARHLQTFTGILQADAYSGYNELYDPSRAGGAITSALCWAHARRQFFELADIAANARRGKDAAAISPIALEAVKRIDTLFDIERGINGQNAEERLRVRKEQSAPLLTALESWLREQRARLSNSSSVAKPIDYMLRRWDRFARFIEDGRICLTNNAAERALRGFALGRKSWLFAGSERGADRAAIMATLIMTAKLNDLDPQAWLADVLARIASTPQGRLNELLPWEWKTTLFSPLPDRPPHHAIIPRPSPDDYIGPSIFFEQGRLREIRFFAWALRAIIVDVGPLPCRTYCKRRLWTEERAHSPAGLSSSRCESRARSVPAAQRTFALNVP